jgi:hypothetical protein
MSTTSTGPSAGRSSRTSSGTSGQAVIRVRSADSAPSAPARPGSKTPTSGFIVGAWRGYAAEQVCSLSRNYKWKGHEISSGGQTGLPATPDISATRRDPLLYYIGQVKWTSPITNKLLAEVGYSSDILHYSSLYEPGIGQQRGTPAWFATATHLNTTTSLRTVAGQYNQWFYPNQDSAVGSLTYVTGSHTVKTGMLWGFGSNGYVNDMNADLWQNYQNSGTGQIPVSVTVFNSPLSTYPELKANIGLYVQDQWAFKRVTLNYGIRYEYLKEEIPAQIARRTVRAANPLRRSPARRCRG